MSEFIVDSTNLSGDKGTLLGIDFQYVIKLGGMNDAELKIPGTGSIKRTLIEEGSQIDITRDGTLEFKGLVTQVDFLDGGAMSVQVKGFEVRLADEKGTFANSPWTSTASATIFSDIMGDSTHFSAGTVDAGATIDFRAAQSSSIWNAITNLARKTSQDIVVDYVNSEIDLLDDAGSTSSVATLNDGLQISNLRFMKVRPAGNNIKVYGKGDGDDQITGSDSDATSITKYGTITREVYDSSVMTTAEAGQLATAELALTKDPTKIYNFSVTNPNLSLNIGDVLTLNSPDKDLANESVRAVGIVRGERSGVEFLDLEVANSAYRKVLKTRDEILAEIQKNARDSNTYMQGGPNTSEWGSGLNAKTGQSLKVGFQVSSSLVQDEAGDLRVSTLTCDYDIDPFNKQVGTASYDGSDPHVQNESGYIKPEVAGTSSSTAPFVSEGHSLSTDTLSVGNNNNLHTISGITGDYEYLVIEYSVTPNFTLSGNAFIKVGFDGPGAAATRGRTHYINSSTDPIEDCIWMPVHASLYNASVSIDVYTDQAGSYDTEFTIYGFDITHAHGDGNYAAASHGHPDGSYDINATDIDNISIGDNISEAGAVNATSVNLYVDYWNGASWVNKHSVLATGKTLDTDVDISNGGTLPDATGYWRLRVEPITGTPDFAQAIVKLKYALDS